MHDLCPEGPNSWCKYKADPENYKHKNGLPLAVVNFIKPVFEDLADEKLLEKCLHGKTQNSNECLNKLIWERCTKEKYVERVVIEEAVYSAIAYFNEGAKSIGNLFSKVGVRCEQYSQQACARKDDSRLYHAAYKTKESTQKRRKVLRAIRKGFQDKATEAEGDLYSAGGH